MTLDDPLIREALCCREVFRRLGFGPDEILAATDRDHVHIVLRAQGKEYVVTVGRLPADGSRRTFERRWVEAVKARADGEITDEQFDAVWRASKSRRDAAVILNGLLAKGFILPLKSASD